MTTASALRSEGKVVHPRNRQTLSYLRNLFEERNIRPKNKLGQNFLIDLNLVEFVVRSAELSREDLAVEVGSGTGSLTVRLVESAGAVVSVEVDTAFATLVAEAVDDLYRSAPAGPPLAPGEEPTPEADAGPRPCPRENVRLLHADALRNKNELNPDVLATIRDLAQQARSRCIKLVANLPYAVAVPVLSNLLLTDLPLERMVATVQWELAERLAARPGTADYGALSVLVQSLAEVEILRKLPPAVFWPRPEVESAIVLLKPDPAKRAHVTQTVGDVQRFRNFLRDLYVHRRKNLRGALAGAPSGRRDKADVDARLAELGVEGTTRAEDLDLELHLRLCSVFG